MFQTLPFDAGPLKEKLAPSNFQEANASTRPLTSQNCLQSQLLSKRKLHTPASAVSTKRVTLNVKLKTSKESFPTVRSSLQKSDQVSTTTGPSSNLFWNAYTKELSKHFALPTKTGFAGTASNLYNGSFNKLAQNSWFSTTKASFPSPSTKNLQTIYSQLSTTLWQKTTAAGPLKKEKQEELKCRMIRLFPNNKQRLVLREWFHTARWTFNQALHQVKNNNVPLNKSKLRNLCINNELFTKGRVRTVCIKESDITNHPPEDVVCTIDKASKKVCYKLKIHPDASRKLSNMEWVVRTPYDVRDEAMNDVLKAYKTCFSQLKAGLIDHFEVNFRSKKCRSQSIVLHHKYYKNGTFHTSLFGKDPLRASEPLPVSLGYDSRLVWHSKLDHFYLCVPKTIPKRSENQAPKERHIVALDPGVRTFQTTFSTCDTVTEWGSKDAGRLIRLCKNVDQMVSYSTQVNHKKRRAVSKAIARCRDKVRNIVKDLHHRLAKFLCENYQMVLLPKFETSSMCQRARRKINSKTARNMLTWSHYRFQQTLLQKAREYPWCSVHIVDEHYTSKTCGNCGFIKKNLGGAKTYNCDECHVKLDRDVNGARNILLRFLTLESPSGR